MDIFPSGMVFDFQVDWGEKFCFATKSKTTSGAGIGFVFAFMVLNLYVYLFLNTLVVFQ